MQLSIINGLTRLNQVEDLLEAYRSIREFYELRFGGPRGAAQFKEYFVIRDTCTALFNRQAALLHADIYEVAQADPVGARQIANARYCRECQLARAGMCPVQDSLDCVKVREDIL